MIKVGERAPDAQVFVKPNEPKNLSELRGDGPAVLMFFPMAFSSTCTDEMRAISDGFSEWQDLGASVIGLSVDSPYTNVAFADSMKAAFPIVSDFNLEATRAYDVERADLGGLKSVSERAAIVVDSEGTVQYTWMGAHPGVFPPLDEIRNAVKDLK